MDNLTLQADEVEALCSIYGEEWEIENETDRSYSIKIIEGIFNVTIYITLNTDYPTLSPPNVQFSAPNLSRMHKQQLALELDDLENIGQQVIYQLIEKVREYIQNLNKNNVADEQFKAADVTVQKTCVESFSKPDIKHGTIIQDRKSTFQGHVAVVHSQKNIDEVMDCLLENKKISEATHNITAYRIHLDNGSILQDCNDDGEAHAGKRLLHLLQILDAINVVVVVSRWYGGIHLGPDRFRHINNAARQVLQQAGFIEGKK